MIELIKKNNNLSVDVRELVKGDKGDKGDAGYTPIKGIDYFDGERGERGERGFSGVYTGNEAPTDPEVVVWIKPDGGGEELVAAEGGAF